MHRASHVLINLPLCPFNKNQPMLRSSIGNLYLEMYGFIFMSGFTCSYALWYAYVKYPMYLYLNLINDRRILFIQFATQWKNIFQILIVCMLYSMCIPLWMSSHIVLRYKTWLTQNTVSGFIMVSCTKPSHYSFVQYLNPTHLSRKFKSMKWDI